MNEGFQCLREFSTLRILKKALLKFAYSIVRESHRMIGYGPKVDSTKAAFAKWISNPYPSSMCI